MAMAGLSLPDGVSVDGVSLLPLLQGRGDFADRSLFWHYPHYHGSGAGPAGAVRHGQYKLIEWYEDGSVELYDLESDPAEQNDLAAALPDISASLRAQMNRWRDSVGAQMPDLNPEYRGSR
jgi:hypothetical protein